MSPAPMSEVARFVVVDVAVNKADYNLKHHQRPVKQDLQTIIFDLARMLNYSLLMMFSLSPWLMVSNL